MKKKSSGGGGANWMDTYGDMVTLLLCFFVLLYSMCTMDQAKWLAFVQALNPDAIIVEESQGAEGGPEAGSEPVEIDGESVEEQLENLMLSVSEFIQNSQMEEQMTVTKGSGYVFISFDDTVFFAPDSAVLLESGKEILDAVCVSLAEMSEGIDEVRVLGHTAQGNPNQPNNPVVDRTLSGTRAINVTIYMQQKNFMDPARLISMGYGQWRPIADNNSSEGRAQNRRVELIVTGLDVDEVNGDSVKQYYTMRDSESE